MNNLAAAFYMLSQGVPFLQAGEEMLRTKPGKHGGGFDDNSYRSPDSVNSLKWATLDKPEYQDVLSYYKGLIAFRKAHAALHLSTGRMFSAVSTRCTVKMNTVWRSVSMSWRERFSPSSTPTPSPSPFPCRMGIGT